jgi:DMSO reductase anchor subunit
LTALCWFDALIGIGGIIASACIYLVPARPAWNMIHTPLDFLLSAALIGSTSLSVLDKAVSLIGPAHSGHLGVAGVGPVWPSVLSAALWLGNQIIRMFRLTRSRLFEERACAALLNTDHLRGVVALSLGMGLFSVVFAVAGDGLLAFATAVGAVLSARYLFFVSVVPLNMALTFVRAEEL